MRALNTCVAGGSCEGTFDGDSCCLYQKDTRGPLAYANVNYHLSFETDLEGIENWHSIGIDGMEKTIRILRINGIKWDKGPNGLRGIVLDCHIQYFADENGPWPKISKRPNLRIVK